KDAPKTTDKTPKPKGEGPKAKEKGQTAKKVRSELAQVIESAVDELKGYEALHAGDAKMALAFFQKARDLSRTTQARLHWRAGEKVKAEELARKEVNAGPNQVVPLATYIEILHGLGKAKEATAQFTKLRAISGHIDDVNLPPFQRLAPIAKALGLPADWR